MSTVPYLGRIVFIILFQLCVIFAFCWYEPTKKVFLYTKKRLFNVSLPPPFFFVVVVFCRRPPFARTGRPFASGYFIVLKKSDITELTHQSCYFMYSRIGVQPTTYSVYLAHCSFCSMSSRNHSQCSPPHHSQCSPPHHSQCSPPHILLSRPPLILFIYSTTHSA